MIKDNPFPKKNPSKQSYRYIVVQKKQKPSNDLLLNRLRGEKIEKTNKYIYN